MLSTRVTLRFCLIAFKGFFDILTVDPRSVARARYSVIATMPEGDYPRKRGMIHE